MFSLAAMWFVLLKTSSPLAATVIPVIPMIVTSLLSVPLATLADQLPRKGTLIGADAFRGVITAAAALLMWTHNETVWEIYVTNLLLQLGGQLFSPAISGVLPKLFEDADEDLALANSMMAMTGQGTRLAAFAAGGVVVAALGTKIGL